MRCADVKRVRKNRQTNNRKSLDTADVVRDVVISIALKTPARLGRSKPCEAALFCLGMLPLYALAGALLAAVWR